MKDFTGHHYKKIIKAGLQPLFRRLCSILPACWLLDGLRRCFEIQLAPRQLQQISRAVRKHMACRFLVFGVGRDSSYWYSLNRNGVTVFLEDDMGWMDAVRKQYPYLEIFPVTYTTQNKEWQAVISSQERLRMELPQRVHERERDVILVDAPRSYNEIVPGRMQSIYAASVFLARGGDLFVHDAQRVAVGGSCDYLLQTLDRQNDIPDEIGVLRHYRREST